MNRSPKVLGLLLVAVLAFEGAACKKKPVDPPAPPPPPPPVVQSTPAPPPPPPPPTPTPTAAPAPRVPTEDEVFAKKTVADLNAERPLADVFFEYDIAELSEAARTALQKNAEYLKRWPTTRVLIEGHADSRGTNEYNFALGERRAAAVRDYLVSLGLAADRITIVSKGEEQPFCSEETEACWHQNRRGHFIVTAK